MDNQKIGRRSRNKGKRGEISLMHILRDFYGYDVRRGYTFQHESDLVGLPGIHVECKNMSKPNVYAAYEQAVEEAQKRQDGIPVVFVHKDGDGSKDNVNGWKVYLSLADFMDLYGAWNDGKRMDKTSQENSEESDCL